MVNGKLAFAQSQSTDQYWAALLQKAYAKYENKKTNKKSCYFNCRYFFQTPFVHIGIEIFF